MIDGVIVKDLITHIDKRGYFREIIRVSDELFVANFGQLSHSLIFTGVLKAWHGHRRQTQWTYVATGEVAAALYDPRRDSPTYGMTMELFLGDQQPARVYLLPPGVVHGYRCLAGPAHVIYMTSGTYDLHDEVRIRPDDPSIPYDWAKV